MRYRSRVVPIDTNDKTIVEIVPTKIRTAGRLSKKDFLPPALSRDKTSGYESTARIPRHSQYGIKTGSINTVFHQGLEGLSSSTVRPRAPNESKSNSKSSDTPRKSPSNHRKGVMRKFITPKKTSSKCKSKQFAMCFY